MKIRNGFVSNSSSSSFLIYGAYTDITSYDKMEELNDKLKDAGLGYFGNSDMGFYIGKSWDAIGDTETGGAFKTRVEEGVKKVLGEKAECGTHEAAWHD